MLLSILTFSPSRRLHPKMTSRPQHVETKTRLMSTEKESGMSIVAAATGCSEKSLHRCRQGRGRGTKEGRGKGRNLQERADAD